MPSSSAIIPSFISLATKSKQECFDCCKVVKNCLHWLQYLSTCSTADDCVAERGAVEHLGGRALLEEVDRWGQAVSAHSLTSLPGHSLLDDLSSELLVLATMFPQHNGLLPFETVN